MSSYSDAIKEAFASCPTDKVPLDTLEIRQTGVQDTIWIVRARESLTALDENGVSRTFRPCGFQFALPAENEDGFRSLTIAIDNIGREISDFINIAKAAEVPVEVVYRPYLSTDLTQPQMNPPLVLYLTDITVSAQQVQGRATFMNLTNKNFPLELYTRSRFPYLQ